LNQRKTVPSLPATVTLRTVAEHVGLAPCSVSAILNNSQACQSIPPHTRERVRRAAARLNYQPNYSARSLRTKRTYTVALLASDLGHSAVSRRMAGVQDRLRHRGYALIIATCDRQPGGFAREFSHLRQRGVEGLITVQSKPPLTSHFPQVHISPICSYAAEPLRPPLCRQLTEIGRAAADEIIRQIEGRGQGARAVPPRADALGFAVRDGLETSAASVSWPPIPAGSPRPAPRPRRFP
jgi:DNA-binding LacI/PurR family transcriptional regulator